MRYRRNDQDVEGDADAPFDTVRNISGHAHDMIQLLNADRSSATNSRPASVGLTP
ncbi:hypothetical protein ACSV5G_21770 [Agrobacterium cavarae]|uniref:hypothetical protein n=1 Tax=Agrobacterium cavarae TaxID=2528239 RepID=UPI003FD08729